MNFTAGETLIKVQSLVKKLIGHLEIDISAASL